MNFGMTTVIKNFKKDIKIYKELTDSKLKVDNSKLGYIIK